MSTSSLQAISKSGSIESLQHELSHFVCKGELKSVLETRVVVPCKESLPPDTIALLWMKDRVQSRTRLDQRAEVGVAVDTGCNILKELL